MITWASLITTPSKNSEQGNELMPIGRFQRISSEIRRAHAEMLTEATAEIRRTAEATVGGNLHNTHIGLRHQQHGRIVKTELLQVVADAAILASLGEDAAHTILRQMEALHDGLALEVGVEEELFAHHDIVDTLKELLVGQRIIIGHLGQRLNLGAHVFPILLSIVGGLGNLLCQDHVFATDGPAFEHHNHHKDDEQQ